MAANGDIQFVSKAEIEVPQINAKGEKVLVREPASLVVPGTIVIYTNQLTNKGKDLVEKLVITNLVPENTEFLAGSARPESAEITYSVDDGKSYGTPGNLKVTEANGTQRDAEAKDYTHIRWMLNTPLKPEKEDQVEFRVKIK